MAKQAAKRNGMVPELLKALYKVRQEKVAIKVHEDTIMEQLKPYVDPTFDRNPEESVTGGGYLLSRIPGTNRTISAEKLLERGVSPAIVAYATSTTSYFQYRIKIEKKD